VATSIWKTLTPSGPARGQELTYRDDASALIRHYQMLHGLKPAPTTPQAGEYVHSELRLGGTVITAQWYAVDNNGQLEPITIDDLTARLALPLMDALDRARDNDAKPNPQP
jgi:hypothetical protein